MLAPGMALLLLLVTAAAAVSFEDYNCPDDCPIANRVISDTAFSGQIDLPGSLPYFGEEYNFYHVSYDGRVQFTPEPYTGDFPSENEIFLAPFYANLKAPSEGGTKAVCFCTIDNNMDLLDTAKQHISSAYTGTEHENFSPKFLIIATWSDVPLDPTTSNLLTFRCVIATDGKVSFAIFLYKELHWSANYPVHVGFNNEDESNWEMPCSNSLGIEALVSTSNIGESGVWLFQIDGKEIAPACKSKEMCREDSICSCLIEQNENCMCDKRDPDEDMACPTSEPPSTHETPDTGGGEPEPPTSVGPLAGIIIAAIVIVLLIPPIVIIIIIMCVKKYKKKKGEDAEADRKSKENNEEKERGDTNTDDNDIELEPTNGSLRKRGNSDGED